jgi:pimeloyl-ACP methyl ester carboxylesterase
MMFTKCAKALVPLTVLGVSFADGAAAQLAEQPRFQEGFAVADDGTRLYWRSAGEGAQTVVVPLSAWMFEEFLPLAEGRRLIFYDMRNRGGSDPVDETRSGLDYEVRDLEAVRRALDLPKISLIGHSYMGAIVTLYARDHSDRVDRVVLTGPAGPVGRTFREGERPPAPANDNAERQLAELRSRSIDRNDPVEYCRAYLKLAVLLPMVRDAAALSRFRADPCRYEKEWPGRWNAHVWGVIATFGSWDWRSSVSRLDIPFLIVHGTADTAAPLAGSIEWVNALPRARLLRIEGAGHVPWLDDPERVLNAIDQFLRGGWPLEADLGPRQ